MDLETATLAELEAEFFRLADIVSQASDERRAILLVMNKRKAEAGARERIRSMDAVQKDALLTVLSEEKAAEGRA